MEVKRGNERGSALVYILIAIALLAALTMTFMQPSSQQAQSGNTFKSVSEIQSQIDFIRAIVHECVLIYPGGDKDIDIVTEDPDANKRYPIRPNSPRHTNPAANRNVSGLRCPGNPGDPGNPGGAVLHEKIYGGMSGKFLPPAPALFSDWQWYNETDGVFFWIETDKTDAFLQTAMEKLDDLFAECETDIIDATAAARDLDSLATLTCPIGSTCFRVWMITKASAVYNGDTAGDEAACP